MNRDSFWLKCGLDKYTSFLEIRRHLKHLGHLDFLIPVRSFIRPSMEPQYLLREILDARAVSRLKNFGFRVEIELSLFIFSSSFKISLIL
jgi:hypothetical protein